MDMKIKERIGQTIGTLLAEQNKKQKDLAKELGVTDNTISYIVAGKRGPSLAQITTIARFFNVSTDFLFGYDYPGAQTEAVKCIIDFLSDASRMCKTVSCADCKLSSFCYINYDISKEELHRFVKEVGKWAMEHPRKTYAQDFFEKFPKAKPDKEGVPWMCRVNCYGGSCQYSAFSKVGRVPCKACWNEEMEAAEDDE